MSEEKHMSFHLMDKGIPEKLAKSAAKQLTRETIEATLRMDEEELKDAFVKNQQEIEKAKAEMEANKKFQGANEVVKDFRSALRELSTPYLTRNKLILELLEQQE